MILTPASSSMNDSALWMLNCCKSIRRMVLNGVRFLAASSAIAANPTAGKTIWPNLMTIQLRHLLELEVVAPAELTLDLVN